MEVLTFLGYLITVAVLLIALGLILLIIRVLEKFVLKRPLITGLKRRGLIYGILLLILIVPAVQGYREDHPGGSFYRGQWKIFTGQELPAQAKLIASDYGPPDMAGDYTVAMAYALDPADFHACKAHFTSAPFQEGIFGSGEEEWNVLQDLGLPRQGEIQWFGSGEQYSFPTYHVGFHDTQRIILLSGFRSF